MNCELFRHFSKDIREVLLREHLSIFPDLGYFRLYVRVSPYGCWFCLAKLNCLTMLTIAFFYESQSFGAKRSSGDFSLTVWQFEFQMSNPFIWSELSQHCAHATFEFDSGSFSGDSLPDKFLLEYAHNLEYLRNSRRNIHFSYLLLLSNNLLTVI